ncbi:MAG TPA: ADOP family duplicated permease [Thermoanaerobaculia bacterium]|nr:ADOP family duplicated permease [Thermoanaerobaculia bacterium]
MLPRFPTSLRHALRGLAKNPGFTAITLLVLAVGIGANLTTLALADRLLFAPPPLVAEPERLVRATMETENARGSSWGYPDLDFFRDHARTAELAGYISSPRSMSASLGEEPTPVRVSFVTDNYFRVLGTPLAAGRGFRPEEAAAQELVAVLPWAFASRSFGRAEDAVGRSLTLAGQPFTVIGVVGEGFRGVNASDPIPDVWVPAELMPRLTPMRINPLERRPGFVFLWLQMIGRLAPGETPDSAQAELDAVARSLGEEVSEWADGKGKVAVSGDFRYVPQTGERLRRLTALLAGVGALVLLLASANAALLLLTRTSGRIREIGVRLALGASRPRVLAELAVESGLLALGGGLLALLVASGLGRLAVSLFPVPLNTSLGPDLRLLLPAVAVCALATLLVGLAPAFLVSRQRLTGAFAPVTPASGRAWLRDGLVVVQLVLAVVLVTGALVFTHSFRTAAAVDLGFEPAGRIAVGLNLAPYGYKGEAARDHLRRALETARATPGVRQAAAAAMLPFRGLMSMNHRAANRPDAADRDFEVNTVSPGYLKTLGIPLVAGRDFDDGDLPGSPRVALVNEKAAELFWPGESPLGKTLAGDGEPLTIVGVFGDTRTRELSEEPGATLYLPLFQRDVELGPLNVVVEADRGRPEVAPALVRALRGLDANVVSGEVFTLSSLVDSRLGSYRLGASVMTVFGLLALVLAGFGLYGSLSYRVLRERRSLAVRMALGAAARRVAGAVVKESLLLAALGIALGLAGAWTAGRWVESFLFQTQARDPLSFAAAPAVLLAAALLASWIPAARATRVDPARVLREE